MSCTITCVGGVALCIWRLAWFVSLVLDVSGPSRGRLLGELVVLLTLLCQVECCDMCSEPWWSVMVCTGGFRWIAIFVGEPCSMLSC